MVHVAEYLEWDSTELRPVSRKYTKIKQLETDFAVKFEDIFSL